MRESPSSPKPSFAGRNFYVAIRDEELPNIVALNRGLYPHRGRLFRLAARGHWIREHEPVHLFDMWQAAKPTTECGHLLELAQGLRPSQNIFRSVVPVLELAHRARIRWRPQNPKPAAG